MINRALWSGLCVVIILMLVGCGDEGGDTNDNFQIVASTSIVGALASEVAGEHADVTTLMDPGTDPHLYEVTTSDAKAVASADLILINGLGLDDRLVENAGTGNNDVPVVAISQGIENLLSSSDDHDDEEHDDGNFDPHVWQDPLRVQTMVDTISESLAELDPEHAADYQANAAAYNRTLEETHQEILTLVETIPAGQRKLLTNHDSFSYFADRYGFEVVGTVIPSSSTEAAPSAQDIVDLHDLIEQEGVTAIFAEDLIDPKVAEQLAADTGIVIVYGLHTDQLGEPGSGAETVHGMLFENARIITDALKGG